MSEGPPTGPAAGAAEQLLRDELAQGDRAIAAARPVLRLLLTAHAPVQIDDEVVAHIRGAAFDVARQLLGAQSEVAARADPAPGRADAIAATLLDDPGFVAHAQALALEGRAAERLRRLGDIDPVLPPLVQDLAASPDARQAALAMAVLAAQARFQQYRRRLELPLRDLPGDLFHRALLALRAHAGEDGRAAEAAERRLRGGYDESAGRLALLARLVGGLGDSGGEALAADRAGLSIFATALAMAAGQDRDMALLALGGGQPARLALSLRAAGLTVEAAAAQFAQLDPDGTLPEGLDRIAPAEAAALLTTGELAGGRP
ncbi:MAG: hypothetical protein B7Z08_03315 [Sphingomonadales bacterium 32-68-7]|nr:MAG: hypothetical protein B7Z33_05145 [Sphingomonadales bacterium 12-68-11]OYX09872.1 MAG: hypothetical protein B7Z08_03315 [Sphingomonadales bacterium 32-68-7]